MRQPPLPSSLSGCITAIRLTTQQRFGLFETPPKAPVGFSSGMKNEWRRKGESEQNFCPVLGGKKR